VRVLYVVLCFVFFFFFQAEDGIRDFHVTGVQTCALPISRVWGPDRRIDRARRLHERSRHRRRAERGDRTVPDTPSAEQRGRAAAPGGDHANGTGNGAMTHDELTLAIEQFSPQLRAPEANLAHIVRAAEGVDLLLTPELSLTGYDVGDAAHHLALPLEPGAPFPLDNARTDAAFVIGMIERGRDGTPYNACTLVRDGRVLHRHRKIYLPTYGMFDEARFFGSSDVLEPYDLDGWR